MSDRNEKNYQHLVLILEALGATTAPAKILNALWALRLSWQSRGKLNDRELKMLKVYREGFSTVHDIIKMQESVSKVRDSLNKINEEASTVIPTKYVQEPTSKTPAPYKKNAKVTK